MNEILTNCLNMIKYSPIFRGWRSMKCLQSSSNMLCPKTRLCSTKIEQSEKEEEIVIPQRIHRGPTDILQALASTIGRDPTAPHYKYHDDPYLTPNSNYKKRVYAMAQESGRKAAHWIRQENKDYFMYSTSDPPLKLKTQYKNADPPIEAYIPTLVYDDTSEVTEDDLQKCMRSSLVSDSVTVFKLLEAKNPDGINQESRQQFLELLCFFNAEDPVGEQWVEERWFRQGKWMGQERRIVCWKNMGLAEETFDNMATKTPEAYCAIIQGMCKYYQAEKAYALYKECLQNKIQLNTDVYNGLLSVVGFLKESGELKWQMILELLNEMNAQGLKPNIGTLNSSMETITSIQDPKSKEYAKSVLAELSNKCGVQPSLATWYHMLCIYCKEKGPRSDILFSIMDQLDGKELQIRDPKDCFFFVTAMNICRYHLMDLALAKRVHTLLLHGSNYNLIGDSYKESIYYRHYFSVQCRNEPFESFIEFYCDLVPNVYVPEPSVMKEVLQTIDLHSACEYYTLLWSHMVMFGHALVPSLTEFLLDSLVRNLPEENSEGKQLTTGLKVLGSNEVNTLATALSLGSQEINKQYGEEYKPPTLEDSFANIAWDLWTTMESQAEDKTNKKVWTGTMLGNVLQILVRAKKLDNAKDVIKKLIKDGGVSGLPSSPQPFIDFAKLSITDGQPSLATPALSYLVECGFSQVNEGAVDVLGILLNKPRSEIEELINLDAKELNSISSDPNVTSLLSIINQKSHLQSGFNRGSIDNFNAQKSSSSSSDSEGTSDSESSDDEMDFSKYKK